MSLNGTPLEPLVRSRLKLHVGSGNERCAEHGTAEPPLVPEQVHVVAPPMEGNAGLVGVGEPVAQNAPAKVVAVDGYVVCAAPQTPSMACCRVALQLALVPLNWPWQVHDVVAPGAGNAGALGDATPRLQSGPMNAFALGV